MKKKNLSYKNGHVLSYGDYGDEHGYPILVQHGLIASIDDHHLFSNLIESGIRLICIARPGYGASSPYRMINMAEWGEITADLVRELNILSFDILAISSGAPYAYSVGYKIAAKVKNIFILSGTPAMFKDQVLHHWPYPVQKNATIAELETLACELFFSNISKEDKERDPNTRDSMMNSCFGIAQDFKLRCIDWGFELADVRARIFMRHSLADTDVPFITAKMTAQLFSDCRLEVTKSDPHFSEEVLNNFIEMTVTQYCGTSSSSGV